MDWPIYILVRALSWLLNLLPLKARLNIVETVVRLVSLFTPSARAVARKNLQLAFPDRDEAWREEIIRQSIASLARTIVDFNRLHEIDRSWLDRNVDQDCLAEFFELKKKYNDQGFMFATGHLGSFELLAHWGGLSGMKLSFVVRPFKMKRVNRWWNSKREASGNQSIERHGAFREILQHMKSGRDVGVLFDQNVTRNHAVFVNWFGRPAATTKTVALAAMRCRVPIIVFSLTHVEGERYKVNYARCDVEELCDNQALSHDEKVRELTQRVSDEYEKMIRANVAQWFWMHRRWKTSEDGRDDFYKR